MWEILSFCLTDFPQRNDLKARSCGTNGRTFFSFVTEQRLPSFPSARFWSP